MGRVPIAQENRTGEGGERFPKVKLTEKDQKTRFTVIEDPWCEWVHMLKAPEIDDDGHAVKETKRKRNGDPYTDYKMVFVGQAICLGDEGTLREKKLDPANCPACAAAEKSGGDVPGPIQRFAVNVVEYALRGNTWNVDRPFAARVRLWAFNGRAFDEIFSIQEQIGSLREHDITLECEDPGWQRNKLAFQMDPGYKLAPKGYLKELLSGEGAKATQAQLRDACGRETPRARMQDDCDHIIREWRKARNEGAVSPYATSSGTLQGGIEELLGDEDELPPGTRVGNPSAEEMTDPWAEFAPESTSNPSVAARKVQDVIHEAKEELQQGITDAISPPDPFAEAASSVATEQAVEAEGDFNFDDLLDA